MHQLYIIEPCCYLNHIHDHRSVFRNFPDETPCIIQGADAMLIKAFKFASICANEVQMPSGLMTQHLRTFRCRATANSYIRQLDHRRRQQWSLVLLVTRRGCVLKGGARDSCGDRTNALLETNMVLVQSMDLAIIAWWRYGVSQTRHPAHNWLFVVVSLHTRRETSWV